MSSIKVIFDRFFEDYAILITESGKQVLWPKDKLPKNLQPDQTLYLTLNNTPDKTETSPTPQPQSKPEKNQKQIAQAILKEILNSNDQESLE